MGDLRLNSGRGARFFRCWRVKRTRVRIDCRFLNSLGPRQNFVQSISTGLIAGFSTRLTFDLTEIALFASLVALGTGLANTLAVESEIDRRRLLLVALLGLFMGVSMSAGFNYSRGWWEALPVSLMLIGIGRRSRTRNLY